MAFATQYNEPGLDFPRDKFCAIMTNKSMDLVQALAVAAKEMDFAPNPSQCMDLDVVKGAQGVANTSTTNDDRKWFFQV